MNFPPGHILTATRRLIDPFHLQPEQIDPQDICICLARLPRFLGATQPAAYTVAEHCVRVARLVSPAARLAALLHDAHEAYLGDWPRPIRSFIRLADGRTFEEAEAAARQAVHVRFGIPPSLPQDIEATISEADSIMLGAELHQLMGQPPPPPSTNPGYILTDPWPEDKARQAYRTALEMCKTA